MRVETIEFMMNEPDFDKTRIDDVMVECHAGSRTKLNVGRDFLNGLKSKMFLA
jgi:hypothetical protein